MDSGVHQNGETIGGATSTADNTTTTKQFDVVTDYSDHHYSNRKFHSSDYVTKKIMREWKILKESLPESIFVRAYEGKINLLRAVIVGATGTPYHDGLFFFDLAFPSDYPDRPPKVRYHPKVSDYELNPILEPHGYICLSLLHKSWGRDRCEIWNRKKSTVLQVLVSLQALVLNEKPYFNESHNKPGSPWQEKCSEECNDNAFLASCSTMLHLLSRPPKNFEGFVAAHFCKHARTILNACRAYRAGHIRVGEYQDNGSSSSAIVQVSPMFKASMDELYPRLVEAFGENGADLVHEESRGKRKRMKKKAESGQEESSGKRKRMKKGDESVQEESSGKKKRMKKGDESMQEEKGDESVQEESSGKRKRTKKDGITDMSSEESNRKKGLKKHKKKPEK